MSEREFGAATFAYLAAFDRLWCAETGLERARARCELERLLPWLLAEAGAEHLYDRARARRRTQSGGRAWPPLCRKNI